MKHQQMKSDTSNIKWSASSFAPCKGSYGIVRLFWVVTMKSYEKAYK